MLMWFMGMGRGRGSFAFALGGREMRVVDQPIETLPIFRAFPAEVIELVLQFLGEFDGVALEAEVVGVEVEVVEMSAVPDGPTLVVHLQQFEEVLQEGVIPALAANHEPDGLNDIPQLFHLVPQQVRLQMLRIDQLVHPPLQFIQSQQQLRLHPQLQSGGKQELLKLEDQDLLIDHTGHHPMEQPYQVGNPCGIVALHALGEVVEVVAHVGLVELALGEAEGSDDDLLYAAQVVYLELGGEAAVEPLHFPSIPQVLINHPVGTRPPEGHPGQCHQQALCLLPRRKQQSFNQWLIERKDVVPPHCLVDPLAVQWALSEDFTEGRISSQVLLQEGIRWYLVVIVAAGYFHPVNEQD